MLYNDWWFMLIMHCITKACPTFLRPGTHPGQCTRGHPSSRNFSDTEAGIVSIFRCHQKRPLGKRWENIANPWKSTAHICKYYEKIWQTMKKHEMCSGFSLIFHSGPFVVTICWKIHTNCDILWENMSLEWTTNRYFYFFSSKAYWYVWGCHGFVFGDGDTVVSFELWDILWICWVDLRN
jgi:hypothetical protein